MIKTTGVSLAAQWLMLHCARAGGLGSTPGEGTRPHMPQLRVHMSQQEIPMLQPRLGSAK